MKEFPILFKGPLVRAILEGRKTVTRRPLKNQMANGWHIADPNHPLAIITSAHPKKGQFGLLIRREIYPDSGKFEYDVIVSPFGRPGDRLWVRETFNRTNPGGSYGVYYYRADGEFPKAIGGGRFHGSEAWKPSIHMPREACRLLLEVTNVRVERLQDITDSQIMAEGVDLEALADGQERYDMVLAGSGADGRPTLRTAWRDLWNSTGGDWDANPWVWVIEFKRVEPLPGARHGV